MPATRAESGNLVPAGIGNEAPAPAGRQAEAPAPAGRQAEAPAPAGRQPRATPEDGGRRRGAPTSPGQKKLWLWVALLAFSPVCVGVATWAALAWNGSYPTVAPLVPRGWQPVAGVYASFSVPKNWSFQSSLSDAQGDVYYSGSGGAAAQSVTEARRPPAPGRRVPAVVANYLGGSYTVTSVAPYRLHNAERSWEYRFSLPRHEEALGILAWARKTRSEVWLVVMPASATTERVLSTLTLAA